MGLKLDRLNVYIQSSHILRDVSLEVQDREVVCLVGRNGAGKTTTLRTIMGYLRPRSGRITFQGQELAGKATYQVARSGMGYSPEESHVFPTLTVEENLRISTWTRKTGRAAEERVEMAYSVFPVLRKYVHRKGDQMSGGERKMLSVARALALDPQMLLLDEPFEGLSPAIIPAVAEGIAAITRMGHSLLMAESNLHHVPEFATRLYVIERGEILFAGSPEECRRDQAVMKVIGAGTT